MGRLVYAALASLDGFIADGEGDFSWAEPQEDVHRHVNSIERRNSLLLLGRKTYEILAVWDGLPGLEAMPDYVQDYASIWKGLRKLVFSRTLAATRADDAALRTSFDKAEIERLKETERGDIGIGGADLASQALALGLLDEVYLYVFPVLVGSGRRWLECRDFIRLRKAETREFGGGVVLARYEILRRP